MCIDHKVVGQYKCCVCVPLMCGIVTIFVLEIFGLYIACMMGNIFGILTSSGVLLTFILAFIMRENSTLKYTLASIYAFTLVAFVVYMIIFLCTTNIDTIVYNVCQAINTVTNGVSSGTQSQRDSASTGL